MLLRDQGKVFKEAFVATNLEHINGHGNALSISNPEHHSEIFYTLFDTARAMGKGARPRRCLDSNRARLRCFLDSNRSRLASHASDLRSCSPRQSFRSRRRRWTTRRRRPASTAATAQRRRRRRRRQLRVGCRAARRRCRARTIGRRQEACSSALRLHRVKGHVGALGALGEERLQRLLGGRLFCAVYGEVVAAAAAAAVVASAVASAVASVVAIAVARVAATPTVRVARCASA